MTSSTQRTVVITGVGAERGIGRATAHRFARDGWAVAGLDLDGDASAKLATELTEQYGVPAYGGTVNVADEDSVLAARDAVHAADLPTVGAVLNIAGITSPVPFLETTLDAVEQDLRGQRHRHLPGHQGVPAGHDRRAATAGS